MSFERSWTHNLNTLSLHSRSTWRPSDSFITSGSVVCKRTHQFSKGFIRAWSLLHTNQLCFPTHALAFLEQWVHFFLSSHSYINKPSEKSLRKYHRATSTKNQTIRNVWRWSISSNSKFLQVDMYSKLSKMLFRKNTFKIENKMDMSPAEWYCTYTKFG